MFNETLSGYFEHFHIRTRSSTVATVAAIFVAGAGVRFRFKFRLKSSSLDSEARPEKCFRKKVFFRVDASNKYDSVPNLALFY